MDLSTLINNSVNQFVASLTKNLKPNESAAIGQLVQGMVALIEAEAINRGGPALLSELATKYPNLGLFIAQAPELQALLPASTVVGGS
jgi:hypothetical protein